MSTAADKSTVQAWIHMHRAHRLLQQRIELALKQQGLPPLEWYDLLLELLRHKFTGLRQLELGNRLFLSKYNLSRLIDRMAAQSLLLRERSTQDGRGNLIRITPEGEAMLAQVWPVYAAVLQSQFGEKLNHDEAAQLREMLSRVLPRG